MSRPSEGEIREHQGQAAIVGIMAAILKGADVSATTAARGSGAQATLASNEDIAKRAMSLYNAVWEVTS